MRLIAASSLLLLASTAHGSQDFERMLRTHQRSLAVDDFVLNSCNKMRNCVKWSEKFGTQQTFTDLVTIACDECVRVDVVGEITLAKGLDIHGTLDFPEPTDPTSSLTLITPKIVVQGLLKMRATKPVDGSPNYTFYMVDEVDQTFQPFGVNADKCGGGACTAGMKSITVAGGQVDSKFSNWMLCKKANACACSCWHARNKDVGQVERSHGEICDGNSSS